MIVKRFYDTKLAQTSYLIGCGRTGSAVVIDANRNIEQYLDMAKAEGVAITHVTETHIHADFVSGSRELAHRTGATLYLSDEGDADWKYAFARSDGASLLKDGDSFKVGNVVVAAVHTPGHTPEHLGFLITDTAAANEPIAMVTGDFVFVGDVGRPDLLERAAKIEGSMEGAARALYASLQRFRRYPDWLQIWPGHGAGSACGKGLSAVPHSTVGYERLFNWAFGVADENEFVQMVLAGQPEPPKYFAEMKRINKAGPLVRHGFTRPAQLSAQDITRLVESHALVIDIRPAADFAAGHIPDTINIPQNESFTTWAGWLIPYDRDVTLIVNTPHVQSVDDAVRDLAMIGIDRVSGYADGSVLAQWATERRALETIAAMTPSEVAERLASGAVHVVDVRGRTEWEAGHIEGVDNIPAGYLVEHLEQIPRDTTVVLHCQTGARSAIGASVLQAQGFKQVVNMTGGITAWLQAGLPTVVGTHELRAQEV
ncbi:MAG: rhodanese-like domain-containing protein [Gemmatimonadaceae bacterium]|nr:rhodanese-like domain-containing protein [Gemmatimonadaceae bacterium]